MKCTIPVCGTNLYFSNGGDGFEIVIYEDQSGKELKDPIGLYFRPWDSLAPFVSNVATFSCSNPIMEVPEEGLQELKKSFEWSLKKINEEIDYRKNKKD